MPWHVCLCGGGGAMHPSEVLTSVCHVCLRALRFRSARHGRGTVESVRALSEVRKPLELSHRNAGCSRCGAVIRKRFTLMCLPNAGRSVCNVQITMMGSMLVVTYEESSTATEPSNLWCVF